MMHDRMNKPDNPLRPNARSANLALMIIHDWPTVAPLESELMDQGYQVLRAQHAMHGYWLAMNVQPRVIVTDLHEVESPSDNLLRYLKQSDKTRAIPVIYLSDCASAQLADRLRSRGITRCLPTDIDPPRFARELKHLLRISEQDASKIDAVFSELGNERPTALAPSATDKSPVWLPHRVDRDSLQEPADRSATRPHELKTHPSRSHRVGH